MKVKEFVEIISSYPDHYEVILTKDSEGNDYSPFAEASAEYYIAESGWSGYLDDDNSGLYVYNAVVLWPVN